MLARLAKLATGALVLGIVQSASAADLPVRGPAMVTSAPIWSWTGFYIGINGGFGGNKTEYPFSLGGLASGTGSVTSSGGLAGGQIGYNWEWTPGWVFGIETDIQWSNIESEVAATAVTLVGAASLNAGTELDWFGTVRGRLGYSPWARTLLYGTGGWAYGKTTTRLNVSIPGIFSDNSSHDVDRSGWTAGAGFEYAFLPNVTFKTEYLYVDLGTENVFTGNVFGGAVPFTIDDKTTFHLVRAGVNWKF
jgi:outer membrane immunogenic protein